MGRVVVVDGGLRLRRVVADGQHLRFLPRLLERIYEPVTPSIQPRMPNLMVDAHPLRRSGRQQPLASLIPSLVLVHPNVGQVGNAVLLRPRPRIVPHHGNPRVNGPHDGVLEQLGIRNGHRQPVRLRSHRLVNERRRLLQVKLVRTQDGVVDVKLLGRYVDPLLHHAPEGVPGAQSVLDEHQLEGLIRLGLQTDTFLGHKTGAGRRHSEGRHDAVAIHQGQPHDRGKPLEVGLLIDGEQGQTVFNVGFDLGAQVEGAVVHIPCFQAPRFHKGVEGVRPVGPQGEERIHIRMGRVVVVDGGLRLRRVVADGQHLRFLPRLLERIYEPVTPSIQPRMPNLMVDAHPLRRSGRQQPLASLIPSLVLVHPNVGQVGNAVLLRPRPRIVPHHGNPRVNGPHDGVLEQLGIRNGHRQPVRLRSHRLVNERRRLLQVKLVRTQDRQVHVHRFGCVLGPLLHRAPEGIPGAQGVLHHDDLEAFGLRGRHLLRWRCGSSRGLLLGFLRWRWLGLLLDLRRSRLLCRRGLCRRLSRCRLSTSGNDKGQDHH